MKGDAWLYYTNLPSSDWSIAIVFPEKELLADLHYLFTTLVALAVGGILLIFIVITVISKRITRPIEKLAKVTANFGLGNFDVELPKIKRNDEIDQLTNSFEDMRRELKRYIKNLEETTAAKNRIESELKIAHDIQQGIIPKIFPPFPNRKDVDLYAVLDPAKEVGGDLYDFFLLDKKRLVFAIGDVSGKGVPASLFMAITRTLLRAKAVGDISAPEIVTNINKELCKDNDNAMFVTFFLGILNLENGDLDFCNAGHNYPYILKSGASPAQLSQTHGTPLGLFDDIEYKSGRMKIEKGDALVLYTDGIPEAMDKEGNLFGDTKLKEILFSFNDDHSPKKITKKLLEDTKDFEKEAEQSDDITILVLTYYNNNKMNAGSNELLLQISNKVEEISKVNAMIDQACELWNIDVAHGHKINLALEEIVSNIINYSFTNDKTHLVNISMQLIGNRVCVQVTDDGKAFNPLKKKDPDSLDKPLEKREIGGLGIYFVKQFMDNIEYRREDGKNILFFEKELS
jgi:sigma-B regulation protein RsbU (phosphoserine phosphatase)